MHSLTLKYSVPEWIVSMLSAAYGEEKTEACLSAFLMDKVTAIRVNPARTTSKKLQEDLSRADVRVTPAPGDAFFIRDFDSIEKLPGYSSGDFYVQDISTLEVCRRAGIRGGERILDVCAAPGGKALHAASLLMEAAGGMEGPAATDHAASDHAVAKTDAAAIPAEHTSTGHVTARDLSPGKVRRLQENITRSGLTNITAEVWDATRDQAEDHSAYDLLIADLPCSGLGILRRKPDIKYRVKQTDIEALQALQRRILETVQAYVKPGGTLIYSTCTISRMENEDNAAWIEKSFPAFTLESAEQLLPDETHDGFFVAVFKKKCASTLP